MRSMTAVNSMGWFSSHKYLFYIFLTFQAISYANQHENCSIEFDIPSSAIWKKKIEKEKEEKHSTP